MRDLSDGAGNPVELEDRRMRAISLWQQGETQAAVARRFDVAPQTVARWVSQFRLQGMAGLKKAKQAGRKPKLDHKQREGLEKLLLLGPQRMGYETPGWTCTRVADLIEGRFGVRYHTDHVWKLLTALGWAVQRPVGQEPDRKQGKTLRWVHSE
jgi:transposase